MQNMTKEQRAIRDADFAARMEPRVIWDSERQGTAARVVDADGNVEYRHHRRPKAESGTRKLTEAEDNAIGRAKRRRQNRHSRGWLPHAKR